MNEREEINQLREELAELKKTVSQLSQSQQTYQPTSVQEQMSQEIMSRVSRPDQETRQFSGR
jgi:archaellum component FlaC